MEIRKGRFAGRIEGDLVVFPIGMRVNRLLHASTSVGWRHLAARPMLEDEWQTRRR